jgi:hypothetical protein
MRRKSVVYDSYFYGDLPISYSARYRTSAKCYDETIELVSDICDHFYYIFGNHDRGLNFSGSILKGLIDREKGIV